MEYSTLKPLLGLLFFVAGFLCVRDPRLWRLVGERRRQHLIVAVLLLIGLRISLQGRPQEDPVLAQYRKLGEKLSAAGLPRDPWSWEPAEGIAGGRCRIAW